MVIGIVVEAFGSMAACKWGLGWLGGVLSLNFEFKSQCIFLHVFAPLYSKWCDFRIHYNHLNQILN